MMRWVVYVVPPGRPEVPAGEVRAATWDEAFHKARDKYYYVSTVVGKYRRRRPRSTDDDKKRKARGRLLAKREGDGIRQIDAWHWSVRATVAPRTYVVDMKAGSCTCPDWEKRQGTCKHQWAVYYRGLWGGGLGHVNRMTIGWYQTNLSRLASYAYREPDLQQQRSFVRRCLCVAERYLLEGAFIDIEGRLEALSRVDNHHTRQLCKWLTRWSQRIYDELTRRGPHRTLYSEMLSD